MDNKFTQHTQPDVTSQQLKYLLLEGGVLTSKYPCKVYWDGHCYAKLRYVNIYVTHI